jgi:hypothetical protein
MRSHQGGVLEARSRLLLHVTYLRNAVRDRSP